MATQTSCSRVSPHDSCPNMHAAHADETSRENYEKYGHPDGPQSLNMGVALPEWMFAADSKAAPLLLIGLVSLCVLLPLVIMAWFLSNSTKYMGSSGVMAETLDIFFRSAPVQLVKSVKGSSVVHQGIEVPPLTQPFLNRRRAED